MALSLVLCAAHMVDYGAKFWLLACLFREPGLRAHFVAVAAAHVGANMHNTYLFLRAVPRLPIGMLGPLLLCLGVATPLMQVVHICDAIAAWWVSQDMGRRTPLRTAPLDMVIEGLMFVLVALHLRICLILGRLEPALGRGPAAGAGPLLSLENSLALALITSLATVAFALVIWDGSVSLKLSRDMYGWPGQWVGGAPSAGLLVEHLAYRGSEVAGKAALLAALAALLGVGWALRYAAASYLGGLLAILALSPRAGPQAAAVAQAPLAGAAAAAAAAAEPPGRAAAEPAPWPLLTATVLAWPLLFANLPQFVDCPRHAAAAQSLSGLVCGFRALELAAALGAVAAAVLLEDEVLRVGAECGAALAPRFGGRGAGTAGGSTVALGPGLGLGLGGAAAGGAGELLRAWRALHDRRATLGWGLCLLLHYACMLSRWSPWAASELLAEPPQPTPSPAASGSRSPALGATVGAAGGREGYREDFWPPARGIAPLLLAAACERAPLAWPLDRIASLTSGVLGLGDAGGLLGGGRGGPAERRLGVEDFDTIRLIGSGEFGKVFQVRRRSTQQTFAMKRLSKDFYSRRRMTDKAIREIATLHLARDHPFVVKLVHTVETAREWCLVMEYCPHGDLQQLLLAEGSPGLTLARTLRISAEVALALEHLHARGIVFRDLKLENVVLDQDGHAKLTDFGLAKQHRGGKDAIAEAELAGDVYASFTKTFCGSYGYAAPEVNLRRQVHGFAADMYSFGVLLLMMLMGGEVYHDSREPPWERRLPPETPKDLRNIINHLTFEFYWGSHHFLKQACAAHRVEVNLNGVVVLVSRGPRGVRRQERPRRPPNSPRAQEGEAFGLLEGPGPALHANQPPHFPALACVSCEAAKRRWDLAMDLVRVLTNEFPEQRGTVARVKQHAFFAEEIVDWRTVYPKSWLTERVKAKLLTFFGWSVVPQRWEQLLGKLSAEELMTLHDDPGASDLRWLATWPAEAPSQSSEEPPRAAAGALPPGAAAPAGGGLGPLPPDAWAAHYP